MREYMQSIQCRVWCSRSQSTVLRVALPTCSCRVSSSLMLTASVCLSLCPYTALVAALQAGDIAAAGIDVTEVEPIDAASPLLAMPNVLVTPHTAGGTSGASYKSMEFTMENVVRLQAGRPPLSSVLQYALDAPPPEVQPAAKTTGAKL